MKNNSKKVRYAVVGLGHIAQVAILPAFAHAKSNSELVAMVTADPTKAEKLSRKYKIKNVVPYEKYEKLMKSGLIDAVYICLPNHLHADFAIPAMKNGVHVLCEKPLAVSTKDAHEIVRVQRQTKTKLMTAYRLHFEASYLKAVELCRSGKIGDLKYFSSDFSFIVTDPDNIRLKKHAGGGTLWDIGIYCINAARNIFREEPIEVFAYKNPGDDDKFAEVEEAVSAIMLFRDGKTASFTCSFGAYTAAQYQVYGTQGSIKVSNAYEYASERKLILEVDERRKKFKFKKHDQFGPEISYFSDCILENTIPEPSALEGLADIKIIEALYRSINTHSPVRLDDPVLKSKRPSPKMKRVYPGVDKPDEIHVRSPHD